MQRLADAIPLPAQQMVRQLAEITNPYRVAAQRLADAIPLPAQYIAQKLVLKWTYFGELELKIKQLIEYFRFIEFVNKTNWLPYRTVPLAIVEEHGENITSLENRLLIFYKENWDSIRQEIETRLNGYSISEESKSTFREALDAHEKVGLVNTIDVLALCYFR